MATQKLHLGVYGVLIQGTEVLMIKKSRGPYTGKFDLPGGKLEHGESIVQGLNRELEEETGVIVLGSKMIANLTTQVEFEYENEQINMYHVGLIYKITESDISNLQTEMDEEDSLGAEWVSVIDVDLDQLSPFARQVVEQKLYEQ